MIEWITITEDYPVTFYGTLTTAWALLRETHYKMATNCLLVDLICCTFVYKKYQTDSRLIWYGSFFLYLEYCLDILWLLFYPQYMTSLIIVHEL